MALQDEVIADSEDEASYFSLKPRNTSPKLAASGPLTDLLDISSILNYRAGLNTGACGVSSRHNHMI